MGTVSDPSKKRTKERRSISQESPSPRRPRSVQRLTMIQTQETTMTVVTPATVSLSPSIHFVCVCVCVCVCHVCVCVQKSLNTFFASLPNHYFTCTPQKSYVILNWYHTTIFLSYVLVSLCTSFCITFFFCLC